MKTTSGRRRLHFVHGPTPLERREALGRMLGLDLWVKRDDATGGAEAGNKIRKLEFLLADAQDRGATTILTCGGIQSNHARATAILCAQLGFRCVLFLRVPDALATGPEREAPRANLPLTGNVLLDRMVGAEIRLISPADYASRGALMGEAALALSRTGQTPYVIPEGGSNGLGALGYVEAMREVREQIDLGLGGSRDGFDLLAHACGSGGTAAGVALGATKFRVARRVRAFAVCDDRAYFERAVHRIVEEARAFDPSLEPAAPLEIDDRARGPAYAVMSSDQRRYLVAVARKTGLALDPVYTGKALFGLGQAVERGDVAKGARVLFLHTGGLAGLLAQGNDLAEELL
jgi:D-cysteine desulfhydrase